MSERDPIYTDPNPDTDGDDIESYDGDRSVIFDSYQGAGEFAPEAYADEDARTIDFVRDLGAVPLSDAPDQDAAQERVANALAAAGGLDVPTDLVIPTATGDRYLLSPRTHELLSDHRLTIRAANPQHPPKFVAPAGFDDVLLSLHSPRLTVAGLVIDRSEPGAGPQLALRTPAGGRIDCGSLAYAARDDSDADGAMLDVAGGRQASVTLTNCSIPSGASWTRAGVTRSPRAGRTGVLIGSENRASVTLRDCLVAECARYGVNAADSIGPVHVQGGTYRNSNGAQLRLGGPDDTVEGTRIDVDLSAARSTDLDPATRTLVSGVDTSTYTSLRGIRVCRNPDRFAELPDPTDADLHGPRITDTQVVVSDLDGLLDGLAPDDPLVSSAGAIRGSETALGTRIEDCVVWVDIDGVPGIAFDTPVRGGRDSPSNRLVIRRTAVGGDSRSGTTLVARGRSVSVRGGCLARPGSRRDYDLPSGSAVQTDTRRSCPELQNV